VHERNIGAAVGVVREQLSRDRPFRLSNRSRRSVTLAQTACFYRSALTFVMVRHRYVYNSTHKRSSYRKDCRAIELAPLATLASPFKSKCQLEVENVALRHPVVVLRRQMRGRVRVYTENLDRN
jgi:hypothetical protein